MAHDIVDASGRSLIDSMLDTEVLGLSLLTGQTASDTAAEDASEKSDASADKTEAKGSDEARWSAMTAQLVSGVAAQGSDVIDTSDATTGSGNANLLATLPQSSDAPAPSAVFSAMLASASDDLSGTGAYDSAPPAQTAAAVGSASTGPVENGSLSTTVAVAASGNQGIDGLLSGVRWNGSISYSDPTAANQYQAGHPEAFSNFQHIDAQQIVAMHFALNDAQFTQPGGAAGFSVEGFTGLNISYNGANGGGTIRLANTSNPGTAYAYYPANQVYGGDVFFGGSGRTPVMGDYDWHTVLHEIGHALGLKHGQELGGPANVALPTNLDSMEFSVMTYRSFIGAALNGYTNEQFGYAQTYMMYDIAALQYMYGADFTTNSGDTTYSWNPLNGNTVVNGLTTITPGGNRIFLTIWDGNGIDTYDLSAYAGGVSVDLSPGGYSVFSQTQRADLDQFSNDTARIARGNVFNALQFNGDARSLIENAIGGSGADTLSGNIANNTLTGNGGADLIYGGDGSDTLYGGGGDDTIKGGAGSNYLEGGTGADSVKGGAGDDVIVDRDAINFDSIDGGDGIDWAFFDQSGFTDNRVIYDLAAGLISVLNPAGNTQTITGVENLFTDDAAETLIGSSVANQLESNGGNDSVNGGGGADTLKGGAGNDTLNGGSGVDSIKGGAGDDLMTYSSGDAYDHFYGGDGNDTGVLETFSTENYTVVLGATGTYSNGNATFDFQNIENVTTGNNNDTVTGDGLGNVITVNGGNDVVYGGGGNDTVYGGDGDDTIYGGTDVDSIFGGNGDDFLRYISGEAYDNFYGGAGNDTGVLDTFQLENFTVVLGATGTYNNGFATFDFQNIENVTTGENNDTVTGDGLANSINTSGGNDSVYGGAGNDTIKGGAGNDTLNGGSDVDSIKGGAGDDLMTYSSGDAYDHFYGGDGNDTGVLETFVLENFTVVLGATGTYNNGFATFDFQNIENVITGDNNDTVTGDGLANNIQTSGGNDSVYGGFGNDTIKGGGGNDTLNGGSGVDSIKGGAGDDLMTYTTNDAYDHFYGGDGNDTGVLETFAAENFTVVLGATGSYSNGNATFDFQDIENVTTGNNNDTVTGDALANIISTSGGADDVDGGFGNDTIYGGDGADYIEGGDDFDDVYGGNGDDFMRYISGEGYDNFYGGAGNDTGVLDTFFSDNFVVTLGATGTFTGGLFGPYAFQDIENVTTGDNNDTVTGDFQANMIIVNGGNDLVNIVGSGDTVYGGDGNDTVIASSGFNSAFGGTGIDRIDMSAISANPLIYDMQTGLTNFVGEIYQGFEIAVMGNSNDSVSGTTGIDTIYGGGGNDTINGGANGVGDALYGGDGDDTIRYVSGGGYDNMYGGNGIDTGVLDTFFTDDFVVMLGTNGTYTGGVFGPYAFQRIENVTTGDNNDSVTGDFQANIIIMNGGNDTATSAGGNDSVYGGEGTNRINGGDGADYIETGSSADTLNGGAASDTLVGGNGNDQYYVDRTTDVIVETAGNGTSDTVYAANTYVLAALNDIERLVTTNFALLLNLNLTGNDVAQLISANNGNNRLLGLGGNDSISGFAGTDTLDGGSGNDTMSGGADNDTYYVDSFFDVIIENANNGVLDKVLTTSSFTLGASNSIEQLSTTNFALFTSIDLTGNNTAQLISGNQGTNVLRGLGGNDSMSAFGGNDVLEGGTGLDTLSGGVNSDTFVFNTALGLTNIDVITDFNVADDTINLSAAFFAGLTSGFALTAAEFTANALGQATTAFQHIIYETGTGNLWFDVDGTGVAARVQFADLAGGLGLTAADFFVTL